MNFLSKFFFTFFVLTSFNTVFAGSPCIFRGSETYCFKSNLDLGNNAKILSGNLNPTVSPVDAPIGALYLSTAGDLYKKLDAGSTTNWEVVRTGLVDLASEITGTLPVSNGGTGATTADLARSNLGFNDAANLDTGIIPDARIQASGVTQHEANLSILESQVVGPLRDALIQQSNVKQHEEALVLAASQTTSGTFADARISETSVTQYKEALSVQIIPIDETYSNPISCGTKYSTKLASALTVTLPSGSPNCVIQFSDDNGSWETNNLTINAPSSENIAGQSSLVGNQNLNTLTVYFTGDSTWQFDTSVPATLFRKGVAKGNIAEFSLLQSVNDGSDKLAPALEAGDYRILGAPSTFSFGGGNWLENEFTSGKRYHWDDTNGIFYSVENGSGTSLIMRQITDLTTFGSDASQTLTHSTYTFNQARLDQIGSSAEACVCLTNSGTDISFGKIAFTNTPNFSVSSEASNPVAMGGTVGNLTCGYDSSSNRCVAAAIVGTDLKLVGWDHINDTYTNVVTAAAGSVSVVRDYVEIKGQSAFLISSLHGTDNYLIAASISGSTLSILDEHIYLATNTCATSHGHMTSNPNGSDFILTCADSGNMSYVAGSLASSTISTSSIASYATSRDYLTRPTYDTLAGTYNLYSYSSQSLFLRKFTHDGVSSGTLDTEFLFNSMNSGGGNFGVGSWESEEFGGEEAAQTVFWFAGFDIQLAVGQSEPIIDLNKVVGISLESASDNALFSYALKGDVIEDATLGATLGPIYSSPTGNISSSTSNILIGNVFETGKVHLSSRIFAEEPPTTTSYYKLQTITSVVNPIFVTDNLKKGTYLVHFGFSSGISIRPAQNVTQRVSVFVVGANLGTWSNKTGNAECGWQVFWTDTVVANSSLYAKNVHCSSIIELESDIGNLKLISSHSAVNPTDARGFNPYLTIMKIDNTHTQK